MTIGNNVVTPVLGIGRINLKLTSEKTLALQDVHHVPEIRRNLIRECLLVQQNYKLIFESNKVVIIKDLNFIGKRFLCDSLFKLNVKNSTLVPPITQNVETSMTWHQCLGHVNYNSIKRMMHLNLILKLNIKDNDKCEICVEAKLPKKPFKTNDGDSKILELVHSDACDSRRTSRVGNKYFMTFIVDCSKY